MTHAFALALLLAQTTAAQQAAVSQGRGGRVTGRIALAGLAPQLQPLPVTRDMKICGTTKQDESLVVGPGGGVANAVVWVAPQGSAQPQPASGGSAQPQPASGGSAQPQPASGGSAQPQPASGGSAQPQPDAQPAPAAARFQLQQCSFTPRVAAIQPGGVLRVENDDPLMHRVIAPEGPPSVEWPLPVKGQHASTVVKQPGTIRLTTATRPWMRAFVKVVDAPAYAVTAPDGTFTIENAPPGTHKLKIWHERLGEREETVQVAAGETTRHDVALPPR